VGEELLDISEVPIRIINRNQQVVPLARNAFVSLASVVMRAFFVCLAVACSFLIVEPRMLAQSKNTKPKEGETPKTEQQVQMLAADEHKKLFAENRYPSAATCRTCHPDHYREWAGSPHAYAQLSPVFNSMAGAIIMANNGTVGDFCSRCHNQVGMNLNESVFMPNADRHPTSREGITCVVCHRLEVAYGKNSGRFALVEGDVLQTIYGPEGNDELARILTEPETYRVVTNKAMAGRQIHGKVAKSPQLRENRFCGGCHEVTLHNGFRLEETFSQFRASPAAKKGYKCLDCHMGLEPGKVSGFAHAPAAVVGGVPTKPRKRTNHTMAGPDYPIAHPGVFPHNDKAAAFATFKEWLTFDHKAGWGTDEFEKKVPADYKFPKRWDSVDDRYDAREILNAQFKHRAEVDKDRVAMLREGYKLDDMEIVQADEDGIKFNIRVRSGTDGHSVPTGFDTERVVYLQINVMDPQGKVVFKSGDLDPNGDVRDIHSVYVHNGELPRDKYLFNLQSTFVTKNFRGAERTQTLAENFSFDPLPFVRPEARSVILKGHPNGARVHLRGIEPNGFRWANYRVKKSELTGSGPYTIQVRFLAAMVPANLIRSISVIGIDYGLSPREVADAVRDGHVLLYDKSVTVPLDGKKSTINLASLPDRAATSPYAK
jgi:nitrate/TMAO reductase-like tetraheme cytochrome c subunit